MNFSMQFEDKNSKFFAKWEILSVFSVTVSALGFSVLNLNS